MKGVDGHEFYTKTWSPSSGSEPKAAVLFVHGFIEYVDRYDLVFNRLAQQEQLVIFGFDQRGFGRTVKSEADRGVTSRAQAFKDITFFLAHLRQEHPNLPLFLYGHSMGGGLVMAYACQPSAQLERVKGIISSAPLLRQPAAVQASSLLVRTGSVLGSIAPKLKLTAPVNPPDICRDEEVTKKYATDPLCKPIGTYKGVSDMLLGGLRTLNTEYKSWPQSLPLLVYHGTGDKVTDANASEEFVNKLKGIGRDATYVPLEGYYHEAHNEPGDLKWKVVDVVSNWIKSKL